jgi:hypothetical protein
LQIMSRRRRIRVESEVQPKLSDGEIPFEHRLFSCIPFRSNWRRLLFPMNNPLH